MAIFYSVLASYLLLVVVASLLGPRLQAEAGTERGIFRLHLTSVFCLLLVLGIYLYFGLTEARIAAAISALAAHAIVSLSFLEIWSLTEGSYSLQMLLRLRRGATARAALIDEFAALGDGKRENRLGGLTQLRLVETNGAQLVLTSRGRVVAGFLRGLLAFVNIKVHA